MYTSVLYVLLLPAALAQVGPQASKIPPCVASCDPAAIASVSCTNADQYCHCVRQNGILTNITACADKTCSNPSADIYTFTTLFGQVCAQFNISVPVLGSNSSANGTNVTYSTPTASPVPYTGQASVGPASCGAVVIMLAVGLALSLLQV
ncbi:hypothetical protein B0A55_08714 [Friedmanniomyces simplex]|uniref:CFEM domain-containing protein n=1 Tax=Friedmanniomyces simplex TaxID=329884 RepID=A0A4U0WYY3_9PEZI|nr:hypothetical protein B0A55_08714 [Friedmanniomyces simplex]